MVNHWTDIRPFGPIRYHRGMSVAQPVTLSTRERGFLILSFMLVAWRRWHFTWRSVFAFLIGSRVVGGMVSRLIARRRGSFTFSRQESGFFFGLLVVYYATVFACYLVFDWVYEPVNCLIWDIRHHPPPVFFGGLRLSHPISLWEKAQFWNLQPVLVANIGVATGSGYHGGGGCRRTPYSCWGQSWNLRKTIENFFEGGGMEYENVSITNWQPFWFFLNFFMLTCWKCRCAPPPQFRKPG